MNTWPRANKVSEQPGKIKRAVCPVIKRKQMQYKSNLLFDKSASVAQSQSQKMNAQTALSVRVLVGINVSVPAALWGDAERLSPQDSREKPPHFRSPQRALSVKLIFCRISSSFPARQQSLLVLIHISEPCERSQWRVLNVRVNHFLNI